jgi:hypothetical protein
MVFLTTVLGLTAAVVMGQVGGVGTGNGIIESPPSYINGSGVAKGDINMAGYDMWCTAKVADAAAMEGTYQAGNAYPSATGASRVGGAMNIAGGIGSMKITVADYTQCATDTLTITVNGADTVLTEGTEWNDATSNNATAGTIAAAIDTALAAYMDATAASAVVTVVPVPGDTFGVVLATSDTNCLTIVDGAEGAIRLWGNVDLEGNDFFGLASDSDTYIHRSAANTWQCVAGGTTAATFNATGATLYSLDVTGGLITEGDGTYSWTHTPTGVATEGIGEFDGALYTDGGFESAASQTASFGGAVDAANAIWFNGTGGIVSEGSGVDNFETTITFTNGGADVALNVPATSGDLCIDALDNTFSVSQTFSAGLSSAASQTVSIGGAADVANGIWFNGTGGMIAEGATANEFETTFAFADVGADATLTFPGVTGTLCESAADCNHSVSQTFSAGLVSAASQTASFGGTTEVINGIWFDGAGNIVAEGSAADGNEVTLTFANPANDTTLTVPTVTAATANVCVDAAANVFTTNQTITSAGAATTTDLMTFNNGANAMAVFSSDADDNFMLQLNGTDGTANNNFIITDADDVNFGKTTPSATPTLWLHDGSATAANAIQLAHNGTTGTIQSGLGTIDILDGVEISDGTHSAAGHSPSDTNGLYVEGKSEFDGDIYFDGTVYPQDTKMCGGGSIYGYGAAAAGTIIRLGSSDTSCGTVAFYGSIGYRADEGIFFTSDDGDNYSNHNFIFTSWNNIGKDHDHDTLSTNPTLFIHSATDPDSDNTEYLAFSHNATTGTLWSGKGTVDILDGVEISDGTHTAFGHSPNATNGLYVEGQSEFDGAIYFDNDVQWKAEGTTDSIWQILDSVGYVALDIETSNDNALTFRVSPYNGSSNGNLIITDNDGVVTGHATPSATPTLWLHDGSATATNTGSITHNGTNFIIAAQAGGVSTGNTVVTVDIDNETTTLANSSTTWTNTGDGDGTTFTLLNDPTIGAQYCFAVVAAQILTVAPSAGEHLYDGTDECTVSLTSNAVGSTVCITAVTAGSGGFWFETSKTGTWTCNDA